MGSQGNSGPWPQPSPARVASSQGTVGKAAWHKCFLGKSIVASHKAVAMAESWEGSHPLLQTLLSGFIARVWHHWLHLDSEHFHADCTWPPLSWVLILGLSGGEEWTSTAFWGCYAQDPSICPSLQGPSRWILTALLPSHPQISTHPCTPIQ
jgi:hypothetical protein